jgi:hypothetical protein
VVGKEKVWSLAYADDLVVLAREEKGMKEMLGSMEKYRLSQNSRPRENRQMPTTISILRMETKNN